ncbi:leucine-zipper-like transcriptional regulator 1 homolog [Ambystoma mexicanum]|uniref:leucine-zipper-like transcriptional regulator 1 homolog n=1 Tax=Ambystoma mexicanum TaxID=8296 RepID=UPI0037E7B398
MKEESGDWLLEPIPSRDGAPRDRFKHACALYGGFVYIFGGRNNSILSDFWRYTIERNEWEPLMCCDNSPEKLEGHSMVACKGVLYVFGGMLDSGFTQGKTPLWMYNIDSEAWVLNQTKETELEFAGPVNRKSHSAVVFDAGMYLYGGYLDLKGASEEFWFLNFDSMKWTCLPHGSCDSGPGPRYGHSSVVYKDAMYVFGGLVGMVEKNDFWAWNFYSQAWTVIKASSGPPKVMGHSSVVYEDFMLVFGGGKANDDPTSDLWRYQFCSQTWKKMTSKLPVSKTQHSLLGVGWCFQQGSKPCKLSPSNNFNQILKESQKQRPFPNPFQPQRSNKISGITTNGIEMKVFTQCPGLPQSGSKQTLSDNCATEVQTLIPKRETCFLNPTFYCPEEDEAIISTEFGRKYEDVTLQHKNVPHEELDAAPDLLLVGGKPFSSSSGISLWQMKLKKI